MSTFSPVLRSHEGNKPWVNAQFDTSDELIDATVKFSNIHALLKPYLFGYIDNCSFTGDNFCAQSIFIVYQLVHYDQQITMGCVRTIIVGFEKMSILVLIDVYNY